MCEISLFFFLQKSIYNFLFSFGMLIIVEPTYMSNINLLVKYSTKSFIHISKFCPNSSPLGISLHSKSSNPYHSKISTYLVQPLIFLMDYGKLSYVDLLSSIVSLQIVQNNTLGLLLYFPPYYNPPPNYFSASLNNL